MNLSSFARKYKKVLHAGLDFFKAASKMYFIKQVNF